MSAPNLSPAVIDATTGEVLDAYVEAGLALPPEQERELARCSAGLSDLEGQINRREGELIRLYVKAGWWLMRARETYRVCHRGTPGEAGRFVVVEQTDPGFQGWLEREQPGYSRRTAYRYIQGAENVGLTPESHAATVEAVLQGDALKGRRLTDICRKPVDKTPPALPDGGNSGEDIAGPARLEMDREITWWGKTVEALEERLETKSWMHLPEAQRHALADLLAEAARDVRASLKPARALPGPANAGALVATA